MKTCKVLKVLFLHPQVGGTFLELIMLYFYVFSTILKVETNANSFSEHTNSLALLFLQCADGITLREECRVQGN